MKKRILFYLVLIVIGLFSLSAEADFYAPPVTGLSTDDVVFSEHSLPVRELISMVDHSPELKSMLIRSIESAKAINPDPLTNPAQSLEEYYDFLDWAAAVMPWAILPNVGEKYPEFFDRLDQSIVYFYFINDQPLPELEGKGLYHNSIQYVEPYRSWLIHFTAEYGNFLNTEESWKEEYLEEIMGEPKFHMDNGEYEDPSNWKTFNQFFARYLSSPDQRPIASPEDERVIASPCDSVPQGVWKIDENSRVQDNETVSVKSGVFSSVDVLLGDSPYRGAFAGGVMTHTFLHVHDYHRFHFPVSGKVVDVRVIPQDDAAGGITVWDPEIEQYNILCDEPGWQMIETRACVIVETEEYGLVAILPIGMSQVSSVNLEDTVKVGTEVRKGDMMGCFLFGGSDIVMLFQNQAGFEITVPADESGTGYAHLLMGEEYGRFN